jgi:ribosomal protein S18 acetylase RimI-like enzyme
MLQIFEVDFSNEEHCNALVQLMNHYMRDAMGGVSPHTPQSAERLIHGLRNHCNKLCLLAKLNDTYIGLVNCFIGFGTFAARPFINIHDLIVLEGYRDKGIGRQLLEAVVNKGKKKNCAKITLEVRDDNFRAQYLYSSLGFGEGKPPMHFWTKYL